MKSRSPILLFIESIAALVGLAIIPWLPRCGIVFLARVVGLLSFSLSRRDKQIAMANLDVAFPGALSDTEKLAILKASCQSFSLVLLDYFWFAFWTEKRLRRWMTLDETARRALETKPLLIISSHYGNWELPTLRMALDHGNVSCVVKTIESPVFNWIVNRTRKSTGQQVLHRDGAAKGLVRAFRGDGIVGLLLDQNTLPEEGGEFVEFFGLPVPVSSVASVMAQKTGVSVVTAHCAPDARGMYTLKINGDTPVHTAANPTQEIARQSEALIRQHPEYWLWMYYGRLQVNRSEDWPQTWHTH